MLLVNAKAASGTPGFEIKNIGHLRTIDGHIATIRKHVLKLRLEAFSNGGIQIVLGQEESKFL
jgi:hypothetical protein